MLHRFKFIFLASIGITQLLPLVCKAQSKPNIVIIYTDDLGVGDISANGATKVKTPNIDRIANQGLRFTNAYATAATCTPSRFSLLTGKYAWRKSGTNIAPGDAALIIPTNEETMPGMLQKAGYQTAVVGKWHLGLGPAGGPVWNSDIKPGPLEVGFNYSFIMPATGDRVPCVYMENYRIVDLDPADSITVSYKEKIGNEPTGKENPELLKLNYSHGHDATIINGVSRIGWMTGGKKHAGLMKIWQMYLPVGRLISLKKMQKIHSSFISPHRIFMFLEFRIHVLLVKVGWVLAAMPFCS